jgi:hypothetical protein
MHSSHQLTRRDLFKLAGTLPAAAAFASIGGFPERLLAAGSDVRQIAGYNPAFLPDATALARWLKQLHDFGPIRMTGTPQCRAFEEFLAQQGTALGFTLERDQFRLTSWECGITDCSISVVEDGGAKRDVEVVAYPFGGSTRGKDAPPAASFMPSLVHGRESVRRQPRRWRLAIPSGRWLPSRDLRLLEREEARQPPWPDGTFPEKAPERVGRDPAGRRPRHHGISSTGARRSSCATPTCRTRGTPQLPAVQR